MPPVPSTATAPREEDARAPRVFSRREVFSLGRAEEGDEGRLPSADAIAAARALVGMSGVRLDPAARTVRFDRVGMEINLGAIGKGHALDRMAAVLRGRGVPHALLSAGGSSAVAVGGRGRGWRVDVRSRQAGNERLARLRLRDGALATSGAGEQFFEIEGRRY